MSHRAAPPALRRQQGLTLIELLVALTIGLVVTIIALSMLLLGRTGYGAVDSTSQLADRERFAVDTISKVVMQAGFQDLAAGAVMTRAVASTLGNDPEPDIFGWDNAGWGSGLNDLAISTTTRIVDGNRPTLCGSVTDTSCLNGSDVLVVRFQGVPVAPGSATADNTMMNCFGTGETGLVTQDLNERAANVFFVQRNADTGEPSLHCAYYKHSTTAWVNQPLIEGVEAMQVLYGTDNVTPGTPPTPGAWGDTVVDRWLRADQLKITGNPAATRENFRRVRAVRIGLLLRGPVGSAQERIAQTFRPLGASYVATADAGSQLNAAPDGRLRRVVNFTIHIRNDLTTR